VHAVVEPKWELESQTHMATLRKTEETVLMVPHNKQHWLRERNYLTIILRNRDEYHLILISRRGRRPNWLNQGIFRKIEQDN